MTTTKKRRPAKAPAQKPPSQKTFQERLEDLARATKMAGEVANSAGDDPSGINEAALRLAQERLFTILVEADPGEDPWETLPKITRAVADLSRTAVMQRKMKEEIKARLAAKVDHIEACAGSGAKMKDALARVRTAIYGL